MDFDLERKIRLSEESEFKNLYRWSLKETDENGEQCESDLIPYEWSVTFTARELRYHWSAKGEHEGEDNSPNTLSVSESECISGELRPGFWRDGA